VLALAVPVPPKPGAVPPGATASLSTLTPDQVIKLVRDTTAKFSAGQVQVPPEGLECPLPDVPSEAILAQVGWQMVIHFPDLMKLGVFNLATAKMDGFIDCAERNPLLAAGGQYLAVYSPGTRNLDLHDLATLRKVTTKTIPAEGPLRFLGMGLLNPTRMTVLQLVKGANGEALRPLSVKLPELTSSELVPNDPNASQAMPVSSADLEGAMDEAGNVLAVSRPEVSPQGFAQYVLRGSTVDFNYQRVSLGTPAVSADGKYIVCRRTIFSASTPGKTDNLMPGLASRVYHQAPIAGYAGFVSLERGTDSGFQVYALPGLTTLAKLPENEATMNKLVHAQAKDQKEIMLASAYCDRIAYVLPAEKKVVLFPLGLKSGAAGSGFAVPGKRFERKVTIPFGSTVTVQSGPPGLKFDTSNAALVWDVPAETKTGQMIQVIMLVKGADAKETYLVEKISVQ
jgi:hypothetical protein